MSEIDDPDFGRLERRRGTWRCTLVIPSLGGDVPIEFDGYDQSPPTIDQRTCLLEFLGHCDEAFVHRIEEEIFKCAQMAKQDPNLFGRPRLALEKIVAPGDIWQTMKDLSIMVFLNDGEPATLALQWAADWDFDHGLQVLYEIGGRIKATEVGDDYFD